MLSSTMIPIVAKRIASFQRTGLSSIYTGREIARCPSQPRLLHSSTLRSQSDKPSASPSDASTGVDPGYSQSHSTQSQSTPKEHLPSSSTDPFPLPFSSQITQHHSHPDASGVDLNSTSQSDGLDQLSTPLRVPGREDEDKETMIARLIYQTRKRGTLETDLILATFAKKELKAMDLDDLKEFDRLLDEPDWDIFYWCTNRKPVPSRWAESFQTEGRLGHKLRIHTRNDEKAVRWMPEL